MLPQRECALPTQPVRLAASLRVLPWAAERTSPAGMDAGGVAMAASAGAATVVAATALAAAAAATSPPAPSAATLSGVLATLALAVVAALLLCVAGVVAWAAVDSGVRTLPPWEAAPTPAPARAGGGWGAATRQRAATAPPAPAVRAPPPSLSCTALANNSRYVLAVADSCGAPASAAGNGGVAAVAGAAGRALLAVATERPSWAAAQARLGAAGRDAWHAAARRMRPLYRGTTAQLTAPGTALPYGVADATSRRPYMEDRHFAAAGLQGDAHASLYALFDGHAGALAAEFATHRLTRALLPRLPPPATDDGARTATSVTAAAVAASGSSPARTLPPHGSPPAKPPQQPLPPQPPQCPDSPRPASAPPLAPSPAAAAVSVTATAAALSAAFLDVDAAFLAWADAADVRANDGCTALAALVRGGRLYVANTGDSRGVLARGDGEAVALSLDHKPDRHDEVVRIHAAGGRVQFASGMWRVGGVLGVSRALGDRLFKRPALLVTPEPEVRGV